MRSLHISTRKSLRSNENSVQPKINKKQKPMTSFHLVTYYSLLNPHYNFSSEILLVKSIGMFSFLILPKQPLTMKITDCSFFTSLLKLSAMWSNQSILKEINPWIFTARTDAKAETPILWPPDGKNWLIGKHPDSGKDWRQEEKGTTNDEVAGWHQRLNGHEFEWTPGVGNGQGSLVCFSPWGHKKSDMTEQLNWTGL